MLEAYGVSDPGCVRGNNEDYYLLAPTLGLYLVADGMGGAQAGEHASKLAADTVAEYVYHAGQASIEVPPDLAEALAADPKALAMFDTLNSQNRYAILYRIATAKRADIRARRIEQFVAMLARGETVHPQKSTQPG